MFFKRQVSKRRENENRKCGGMSNISKLFILVLCAAKNSGTCMTILSAKGLWRNPNFGFIAALVVIS